MSLGIWQLLIILLIVLVLFGGGRISKIMADFAKGIKSFRKEMSEDEKKKSKALPKKTVKKKTVKTNSKKSVK
ncbi:MAG: twin-arginine translocase TatA/TatE family subunit [Rickettsiales bacterium]|nr:twin-arginine translocase TatA/TatE family subunit [Rickettsiales bacterium]